MLPHHTQAVAMATMALGASKDTQVLALATAIRAGQDPEITTMQGWLRGWGAAAGGAGPGMSAMPDGAMMSAGPPGSAMPGMMSDQQMQRLSGATGATFDRLWITMMTRHHLGAIEMARTEVADGQNPQATTLARQIITAQQAELTKMAAVAATLS